MNNMEQENEINQGPEVPVTESEGVESVVDHVDASTPEAPLPSKPNHPPEGSKRWNEIYYKAKELDRIKEADALKDQKLAEMESRLAEMEARTQAAHTAAVQAQLKEAFAAGDFDRVAALQVQLSTPKYVAPPAPPAPKAQDRIMDQAAASQNMPPMDVQIAVSQFELNNPWFGQDPAMTGAFQALHAQILNEPDFQGKPVTVHLNEALKRTKAAFPYKFRNTPPPAGTAGVPNGGAPAGAAPKGITLTADEKAVAQMIFAGDPKAEERYLNGKIAQMKGR